MSGLRLRAGVRAEDVHLGAGEAVIGGRSVAYRRIQGGAGAARLEIGGRAHRVVVARDGPKIWVWCDGAVSVFERAENRRSSASSDHAADLLAPMPGRVRRILAREGARVERGAVLLALEAMKMEHAIRAPRDGLVKRVRVAEGDLVDAGAELIVMA